MIRITDKMNINEVFENLPKLMKCIDLKVNNNEIDSELANNINLVANCIVSLNKCSNYIKFNDSIIELINRISDTLVELINEFNNHKNNNIKKIYNNNLKSQFSDLIIFIEPYVQHEIHSLLGQLPERNLQASNTYIGEFTYGNPEIKSWGEESKLQVGRFCSISDKVTIFLGGEHRSDWVSTYPFNIFLKKYAYIKGHPKSKGDVIIGNDVWIASGATIMSGVTICDGAIIGAHSIVTKDIPPYAIVAGNPAKIIRFRFEQEVIEALLQIKWWDWDISLIEDVIPFLQNGNVKEFIDYCKENGLNRNF